jgi:hypothetical protein
MALPNLTLRTLTPTVGTTKGAALSFSEMDTNLINLAGANIQVTAGGVTTNIALNSGFTITAGNGTEVAQTSGNITISASQMPQVASGNVTLALTDAGKHYYDTSTAPTTITIPVNSSVAFNTGTVISFINASTGNLTVDKGSTTLYLSGNATSASRTITAYGMATIIKVATDTWFINGNGVV